MYPFPTAAEVASPPPPPPPAPLRPAADPVAAIAGNATMLGLGYMLLRRPILSALALTGTGFLAWSAAVQTENPLWRFLLPAWGLAMILHAWWLTRRARPERLADIADADPGPRTRAFAVAAAALVLLTVTWFRFDAWWIAAGAQAAHAEGDCAAATAGIDRLDAVHRVAFGPAVLRAAEERDACALLLAALDQPPAEGADTMEDYLTHPGALWDGAGPERAGLLFQAALEGDVPELTAVEEGFTQLTSTLDDHPGQADAVRAAVEAFTADLAETGPCSGYMVDDWIAAQTWDAPEITEPLAAAADQVPLRLFDCAQERTQSGDEAGAGILYREFLTDHPGHELAAQAADGVLDSGTYCDSPVAYAGAPAYTDGAVNPMRLAGAWGPEGRDFPESWLGDTAAGTALVVCVDAEVGEFQDSCMYRAPSGSTFWGVFYAHRFTVKAYELRTGRLVADYAREIGDPCPDRLDGTYTSVYIYSSDSMLQMASEFSDADFRGLFTDLMS
ncbi:hypothetical protein [Glycomyces terrestris]|uniref:hypothetical protein n=1 Tax=Glycomyces terrestris TaxID=2493553 RepID=UPI001315267A|nr:hypothetical protein [Glycomyces terrestris]